MAFDLEVKDSTEIKEKIIEETSPTEEIVTAIKTASEEKAKEIMEVNLDSFKDKREITTAIEEFGTDIVRKSTEKNSMLQTRLGTLSKSGGENGEVAKGLEELSVQMKSLDPSKVDFDNNGFLGKLMNPAKKYFRKYQTADATIGEIIESLDTGSRTLKNDNTTLEIEQASMRDLTKQLNEKIVLGMQLDAYLSNEIESQKVSNGDAEKIKFVEEEVLFPLRQRIMDFEQMLAVNQQGILAMEVIRKNNAELIRSVERAKTVTVSALRVAVMVANALCNQKLVLEKVKILNETTSDMIASTSKMLKTQGAEIQKQAIEANIDVDKLKTAFADTLEAFDAISQYKQQALPQLKETIETFRIMTEDGETIIHNIEKRENTYLEDKGLGNV